ncbi:RNA polymerase sigma factor [Thermodesulfobacteriota bacterium]
MINYSDMELVDLAMGGDERAFENLIQRHYLSVYGLSYKWCRIKEEAEEITQEVFIKLTRKLNTFNRESSFKTWIYRITVNTAKDYTRKNSTRRSYESAFAREKADGNPGASPSESVKAGQVYDTIDRLPDKQKASLMLVMAEGLSHKEAAKVLRCSETTVSWRIHQARKRLKKSLTGWYDNGK